MSKIIALFNQAGGVAKTTLTLNLGYHLQERSQRVLLLDLDPQASLTTFMGLDPEQLQATIGNTLTEEEEDLTPKPIPIHDRLHGMALAPANISLSAAELFLVNADMRDIRLKDALEPISNDYDFILIDCPPSLADFSRYLIS